MWVQFRNIPFYLLTKKLAHDLREIIGSTMKIDDNARGYINDKFIRTRVLLPLFMPLQREITLVDEITGDAVLVQIRYERLLIFCLFYGFIGHMEARCDIPVAEKRLNFGTIMYLALKQISLSYLALENLNFLTWHQAEISFCKWHHHPFSLSIY